MKLINEKDIYTLFDRSGRAQLHVADIDVLPRIKITRAKWVYKEDDFYCSNCNGVRLYELDSQGDAIGIFSPYCPHCAARIDGGLK